MFFTSNSKENDTFTSESCISKINENNKIGKGSYSNVYKYSNKYVIKVCNSSFFNFLDVTVELMILSSIKHENILSSPFITRKNDSIIFVLPYYEQTLQFINKINNEDQLSIMKQLSTGLQHLHSNHILHLDLTPRNILVKYNNGKYLVKICDFSLSCICTGKRIASNYYKITATYRPYENLRGSKYYSKKSDIWSLGVIFYRILTGENLFTLSNLLNNEFEYELNVLFEITKMNCWGKWPPTENEIINKMLILDHDTRIDSTELCLLLNLVPEKPKILLKSEKIYPHWTYVCEYFNNINPIIIYQVEYFYKTILEKYNLELLDQKELFMNCFLIVYSLFFDFTVIIDSKKLKLASLIFLLFQYSQGNIMKIE